MHRKGFKLVMADRPVWSKKIRSPLYRQTYFAPPLKMYANIYTQKNSTPLLYVTPLTICANMLPLSPYSHTTGRKIGIYIIAMVSF